MSSNTQTPTISAQTMNEYIASISKYFYENDDHICGRVRFLWSQLDGTPFSRGEQNLAGWNSMDESKRGGNESFKDKPYTYEEEDDRVECSECEYEMTKSDFDVGKGRIMFDDLEEGKFRCGVCDDRVYDPQGMFPNDTDDEEEEEETFVKWTEENFCDRETCYFCKTKNVVPWTDCEDAVCLECSDKWEYLDDYCGEGYYRECYDCGACGKCKEWNTDSEE